MQRPSQLTLSPSERDLPAGTVGFPYSQTITASGGSGSYTFSISSGTLPLGLSLDPVTGEIFGTPTAPTSSSYPTVTATDTEDPSITGSVGYRLPVGPDVTLSDGTVGVSFPSARLSTGRATTPSWGTLPPGLTITVANERSSLGGTPEQAGTYVFGFAEGSRYTITILPAPVTLSLPDFAELPVGSADIPYSTSIPATGGSGTYVFTVDMLPPGLSLDPATGEISGTPQERWSTSLPITVTVTDANDMANTASGIYRLPIGGHTILADATVGTSYPGWRLSTGGLSMPDIGSLPPGMEITLSGRTMLEGTPQQAGTYVFGFSPVGERYTITVLPAVVVRPDPTQDPQVTGLLSAQSSAARRFAETQMTHFHRRLEQLHQEGTHRSSNHDGSIGPTQANPSITADPGPFAVWSSGFVTFGEHAGGGIDLDHTLVGVTAGADYRPSGRFITGIGVGYGRDRTDVDPNGTQNRASAVSGAIYGSYNPVANLFIDGLVGGSSISFDFTRFVTANGDSASGNRAGNQVFASMAAAYEFQNEVSVISPFGRVEFSRSWLESVTEHGGGDFRLSYSHQAIEALSGVIGIRANHAFQTDWGTLTPGIRAEYARNFHAPSQVSLGYADLGGLPYTIDIDPDARDHAALGLSLDYTFGKHWNLGLTYHRLLGGTGNPNPTFDARLDVRF